MVPNSALRRVLLVLLLWARPTMAAKHNKPVRMFILAGEGNIEGFASVGHLHQLVAPSDPSVTPLYQHLINNETGAWLQRDDVYVAYDHKFDDGKMIKGPLQVTQFAGDSASFGPELQMGHFLGDLYEEPVVIVKAGWQKRSLGKDFASPSTNRTGFQWYRLINSIQQTASSLHEILGPDYRYTKPQIGGLVWWQGYTDLADPQMTKDYAENLNFFVNDIRDALKQPEMPVVVVELGGQGVNATDPNELMFREMQERVVKESFPWPPTEFVSSAKHVKTDLEIKDYTLYWGRADTMIEISEACAVALVKMDYKLTQGTTSWFIQDADVSMGYYKAYWAFHYIIRIVVLAVICFVAVAVWNKGDFRGTWNAALTRCRSLSRGRHSALDTDDDCNNRNAELDESERSVPELRDA